MILSTVHTQSYLLAYLQMSSQSTVDDMSYLGVDLAQLVQILTRLCLHRTEKTYPRRENSSNMSRIRRSPLRRNVMGLEVLAKAGLGLAGIYARWEIC
jgi:hypothetical protein